MDDFVCWNSYMIISHYIIISSRLRHWRRWCCGCGDCTNNEQTAVMFRLIFWLRSWLHQLKLKGQNLLKMHWIAYATAQTRWCSRNQYLDVVGVVKRISGFCCGRHLKQRKRNRWVLLAKLVAAAENSIISFEFVSSCARSLCVSQLSRPKPKNNLGAAN